MIFRMISEGARILKEGIVARPRGFEVIWIHDYGWPVWRGRPTFYADQAGLTAIYGRLAGYARSTGDASLEPAQLLAARERRFGSLGPGAEATA